MDIAGTLIELLRKRAPAASVCPSEVARALAGGSSAWRTLMQPVRDTAATLARAHVILITQGARRLEPGVAADGPIRLRRGPAFPPMPCPHDDTPPLRKP